MSDLETNADDVFDVDRIRRLVELMEGHDLREVDLRHSDQRIRLCRGSDQPYPIAMQMPAVQQTYPATPQPPVAATPASAPQTAAAAEPAPSEDHIVVVRSPMVGTFYARANPNVDPYVNVGDMVDAETTICIIEAMKVFNEIPAETRGKVVAVLADDEEPVDHGRPLFKIDTTAS